jgi:hypothetical protein
MTDDEVAAVTPGTIRFFWWCRLCGWWSEVDFGGLCPDCRHQSDRKHRGATPDDVERLTGCARCCS